MLYEELKQLPNAQNLLTAKYTKPRPHSLTKLDLKLIEESGFKGVFEKEKDNLASKLSEKQS